MHLAADLAVDIFAACEIARRVDESRTMSLRSPFFNAVLYCNFTHNGEEQNFTGNITLKNLVEK